MELRINSAKRKILVRCRGRGVPAQELMADKAAWRLAGLLDWQSMVTSERRDGVTYIVTMPKGMAALFAPPPEGRLRCSNIACAKTFKRKEDVSETMCGTCWRALPSAYRLRYRELRDRWKKLERAHARGRDTGDETFDRLRFQMQQNWRQCVGFYDGDSGPPEGLDDFLAEMGLDQVEDE